MFPWYDWGYLYIYFPYVIKFYYQFLQSVRRAVERSEIQNIFRNLYKLKFSKKYPAICDQNHRIVIKEAVYRDSLYFKYLLRWMFCILIIFHYYRIDYGEGRIEAYIFPTIGWWNYGINSLVKEQVLNTWNICLLWEIPVLRANRYYLFTPINFAFSCICEQF